MKKKVCVIGVYFGILPEHFNLWLKSCFYNKEVDFYVFTDNIVSRKIDNVNIINITLKQLKELCEEKIGVTVNLSHPYKCCDLKPFYGTIFQEYLKDYSYWAHCWGYNEVFKYV